MMMPGIRHIRQFFKTCCLTERELAIIATADELFAVVNTDSGCCELYPKLGSTEKMLFGRLLRDEKYESLYRYREFLELFAEKLGNATDEDGEGGKDITMSEFEDAMLDAVHSYLEGMIQNVKEEFTYEYENMEEDPFG
jgi:hypothetical protein